ncbi:MAG: hypothetical protein SWK90_11405 [Chloroflexota bacterium]|nr:hypothetical protein [Chloroflexota bacterium]
MTTYVEMHRSPTITDAERRAKIGRVYRFLLSLQPDKTADAENPGRDTASAAGTPAQEHGSTEELYHEV